jgi:nucleoside-diphosphate-sugar epimerase
MAKALITGASGFIGSHLANALKQLGDEVTCLVRGASRVDRLQPLGVRLAVGDVLDVESLRAAVCGQEVVYHVAGCVCAIGKSKYYQVNGQGTHNVAQACAEQASPPVLVLVSSQAAAGPGIHGRPRTEQDRPVPVSVYGRSKRQGELAAESFADRVPISVVRPPIVFGQSDPQGLAMFRSVARFGIHLVPGLARSRFSIVHADDLVHLLILAAERGQRILPPGQIGLAASQGYYFAGCEQCPIYSDLGQMIGDAVGRRRVFMLLAAWPLMCAVAAGAEVAGRVIRRPLFFNIDKFREASAGSWICSTDKARDELGYEVLAPLPQRVRQTADWYRKEGWL